MTTTVSYSITAGNGDGKFNIDVGTGAITVAATLDHETADEYVLTVEASTTVVNGTATVTVTGDSDGRSGVPATAAHGADGDLG